ncbi:unnamed protein product [Spirodela intermedia]|uniref:Sucrose-phosphate synthase n=1 Tax=Spirodela intermedia TaxID=51605 RepID=A0A7I8KTL3_SPIIN|nr:unnamed protein product [Spirodela intermedia]
MAGNEWINGYLEAILDAGGGGKGLEGGGTQRTSLVPQLKFSPTKYFVEEVVNGFDEADLYKTWTKVTATRNLRDRSNRLENMCWRIWHLTRRKKQIEREDVRRLTERHLEREQGHRDASEDLPDLSEGEKDKENPSSAGNLRDSMSRINSDVRIWSDDDETRRLYIVLISLHGLVRGDNMELGRDSDTGGQVKYVVELARALASTKGIYRVDLLTRQIASPDVDWSYGEPVEMLSRPSDLQSLGDGCGAYIIRLPCGPRERYLAKETLWPHIPEFIDRALVHITNVARALGEQTEGGKPAWPYVIHGHYADAGEVAGRLAGALNVPMVLTGHSLGRNKFEQLLKQGRLSREEINSTYRIARRIEAEEFALDAAEMIVTSTRQEIEEQWGLYDGFDLKIERKLRVRRRRGVSCLGRHMPRVVVIPPGMDFSYVTTQDLADGDGDLQFLIGPNRAQTRRNIPSIWTEVMRFFTNPHKPMILALSRPDPKKNVTTLLKAFGQSRHLQELANLTLILGNRDDVEEMPASSSAVLTTVLKLIDKYDLYGQVAYPKHHKQSEVPDIYRLAAKTKGVFVNPALVEPFGLTLIEAAANGLPIVATKNGGPVDILKTLNNGLLVDPHDQTAISEALLKLVADKGLWLECRKNGLKNIHRFSWPEHCRNYLSHVEQCRSRHPGTRLDVAPRAEEPLSDSLKDVDDLSIRSSVNGGVDLHGNGDVTSLLDALRRHRPESVDHPLAATYFPGRRRRLFVIAADCYDPRGQLAVGELKGIVDKVAATAAAGSRGRTGLLFSTGSTVAETIEALKACRVAPAEFDALICSSGSVICYPWKDLAADPDYSAHVDHRWPGEHIKSAVPRLAMLDGAGKEDEQMGTMGIDLKACNSHCYAYSLKTAATGRKVDELRQKLRMRGFRCNLVYTCAATRLNVVPLFASRTQAMRYLWTRWGVDPAETAAFVGEKGDTDAEELRGGLHRTVVLGDVTENGGEALLRGEESYGGEDVVPSESPNVAAVPAGYGCPEIVAALASLGVK